MTELVCESVGAAAPVKTCSVCGTIGPLGDFLSRGRWCKKCDLAYKRKWYAENKAALRVKNKAWRMKNTAKLAERQRTYYAQNRETVRRMKRDYMKRRRAIDPQFRLSCSLRTRVRSALYFAGTMKATRTAELVGCSMTALKAHLESQFLPGMSWDNYGGEEGWQIDHYIACAQFDLTDNGQQRLCMNWRNLRPLPKQENFEKDDTLPEDWKPCLEALCSALGLPVPVLRDQRLQPAHVDQLHPQAI